MPFEFAWLITPAILTAGFFLSVLLEKLAKPAAPGFARPLPSLILHAGLWSAIAAIPLAVSERPLFSCLLCLCGELVVIQISNAKHRALREPFIFSDFGIFSQTLKHPRLYLPFLGIGRFLILVANVSVAFAFGWWLEEPAKHATTWSAIAILLGTTLVGAGLLLSPRPSLKPASDVANNGLFVSIAQYWAIEKRSKPSTTTNFPAITGLSVDRLPDVVVVQSESFFDPRRGFPCIRQDLLPQFDEACTHAVLQGKLTVPSWGANTMRPEFAFLTGIQPAALDIHRFNPYRRVARRPVRALPAVLREAGYSTTCIHPHPARFFRRDRAFPNLGFERFVDIREFRNASRCGPYIGDASVTDKLLETIERANSPAFYFVITMENHGPLHLENFADHEARELFTTRPPASCADLGVYLRHLKNADEQLGRLRQTLQGRSRPYVLLFYGEHLPSMPLVYDVLGLPDGRTDYFIESSTQRSPETIDLTVEELPCRLLGTIV